MRSPAAILVEEHVELSGIVKDLEACLDPTDREALRQVLPRLTQRLEAHRRKEEIFFHALAGRVQAPTEVLDILRREHGSEGRIVNEMRALLSAVENDATTVTALGAHLRRTIEWLRDHFWKEETFIFQDADSYFSEQERRALTEQFETLSRS
ncbi:MAG: hemerythrin domain-containing protein [Planctomycetes bacterium]|nr:hemerythrin domain-containing protein [Planctomycetota bacterium]